MPAKTLARSGTKSPAKKPVASSSAPVAKASAVAKAASSKTVVQTQRADVVAAANTRGTPTESLQTLKDVLAARQQELIALKGELDLCVREGRQDRAMIARDRVKDCEARIDQAEQALEAATQAVGATPAKATPVAPEKKEPIFAIKWGEIGALLTPNWRDALGVIGEENKTKWPLLVDVGNKATTFFRYRDANFVDTFHPGNLQPEALRQCLVGALRFGKPLVIDLHDVNMWDFVINAFDAISAGTWSKLTSGEILKMNVAKSYVRPQDGPLYNLDEWSETFTSEFLLICVASAVPCPTTVPERFVQLRTSTS